MENSSDSNSSVSSSVSSSLHDGGNGALRKKELCSRTGEPTDSRDEVSKDGEFKEEGLEQQDDMARMIMNLMKENAVEMGCALKKRSMIIDSICWLSQHVPRRVLFDLLEEMEESESKQQTNRQQVARTSSELPPVPSIEYHNGGEHSNSRRRHSPKDSFEKLPDQMDKLSVREVAEKNHSASPQDKLDENQVQDESSFADSPVHSNESGLLTGAKVAKHDTPFHVISGSSDNYDSIGQQRLGSFSDSDSLSDGSVNVESLLHGAEEEEQSFLPRSKNSTIALLFVDISGFTKLSQALDVENLSKTINMYFEMIVKEVIYYGGDILKFAGDAIFVEWPTNDANDKDSNKSLADCIAIASLCGSSIVRSCSDYPIYAPAKGDAGKAGVVQKIGDLNVHCGVGVGDVAGVHVGDEEFRREFLLVGEPIDQVAEAEGAAALGELAASPKALAELEKVCDFEDNLVTALRENKCGTIASKDHQYFKLKPTHSHLARVDLLQEASEVRNMVVSRCDKYDTTALERLLQKIGLYVHSVVVNDEYSDESQHHHRRNSVTAQERHRAEAELRNVYTMFIMPLINAKLTGDQRKDIELFQTLNKILMVVNRELTRYSGHLRQFIVDDKGVVLIANFGLRGSTFPNMISERALPCTSAIHNALQAELDVDNQVGGTVGNAYCGVVGGIRRHEYAILGPSVNLSARLMCNSQNPGVLVDNRVRLRANKGFSFNALPPVRAKGYTDPVPIFEPLSAAEKRWGKAQRGFVGREDEISLMVRTSKELMYSLGEAKMLFVQAESGTGKTAVLVQALSKIKKLSGTAKKRIILTRNVSNDGDRMIPFSMFRSVFIDILKEMKDFDSPSVLGASSNTMDGESSSGVTESQATTATGFTGISSNRSLASSSFDRLAFLVKELDAPPEFMEIVGRHLLGMKGNAPAGQTKTKGGSLDSIADFMARAFVRCTCHVDLVVLALDDVHLLDGASWKVLERIFHNAQNVYLICASRPLKSYKLEVQSDFWKELHDMQVRQLRFKEIVLRGLKESDIRSMVALKLGLKIEDVGAEVFKDLHGRSGGMPQFALQMIETIERNNLLENKNGKIGWRQNIEEMPDFNFSTVGELIVHRIDSLSTNVRQTLNLCAVLGALFELIEVVTIYRKSSKSDGEEGIDILDTVKQALDCGVAEGIIEVVYGGGQLETKGATSHGAILEEHEGDEDEGSVVIDGDAEVSGDLNIQYRFHHDVWRSNILKLMLDARKRDIHRTIAQSLEEVAEQDADVTGDFFFMIKLFGHWKASGNKIKATELALAIGASFTDACLNTESIKIFDEALSIWRLSNVEEQEKMHGGFAEKVLLALPSDEVKCLITLLVAKGRCNATLMESTHALRAFNDALEVLDHAPGANGMKDRSVTFPIFSGLFIIIKQGYVEQDSQCTYEQEIVTKFVSETKLHGDPVHYCRALGMQAEVLARIGQLEGALESFRILSEIYDPSKHHDAVCQAYGSDRCAQIFSCAVLWTADLGDVDRANELCEIVLNDLLPKMNLRNVHNTMIMLWPVILYCKDRGQHKRMSDILNKCVIKPFYDFYGEDGFTYCLPLYKPTSVLLEVCGDQVVDDIEERIDWALSDALITGSKIHDCGMGNYGTPGNTVGAEVCYWLAQKFKGDKTKRQKLVAKGLFLARLVEKRSLADVATVPMALKRNTPLLRKLEQMAQELEVTDEIMSCYELT